MSKMPEGFTQVSVRIPDTLKIRLEALGWQRHARTGEAVSISREVRDLIEEHTPDLDPQTCPLRLLKAYEQAKNKLQKQADAE